MRQIKGREKTQGNSRKSFTNAKERKGRIREQESAGQLNNKAKTQNNISLSKNRIKTEKRHNQRMAKQIQKSTVEKDRILPEKLIQDSTVWDTIIVGAGAAGMTAALACGKENKKYSFLIAKTRWEERFWSLEMANVISQTLHKSQNIIEVTVQRRYRKYCLCLDKKRLWSCFRVLESIQKIRMAMCIHTVSRRQV